MENTETYISRKTTNHNIVQYDLLSNPTKCSECYKKIFFM